MIKLTMKFHKIITIGIQEFKLNNKYWDKIDEMSDQRVNLPKDSPYINKELPDADCILTGFGVTVDKKVIDNAPNLKYIGALATGYGGIDSSYAKTKNIVVSNIPGYATEGVTEFVFAVILNQIRDLEKGKTQAKEGNYSEAGFNPIEIKGKVFGILGMGRIGARVAELANCFGADVKYWSRKRKENADSAGIKYDDVDALIAQADFLSLHLSSGKETENFLNAERLAKIKSGAIVVNTAPMELVDLDALEERLKTGDITFILDHADEMSKEDLARLSKYGNCIIYPPIAYVTKEASIAKQEIFISNIEHFLKGSPINKVS